MMENRAFSDHEAFTSEDPFSDDENEDVSRAIELSLLESTPSGADMPDLESSDEENDDEDEEDDEDKQLAKTLEESLNFSRNSRAASTSKGRRWKKLSSSLNIFKKSEHHHMKSWAPVRRNDIDARTNLICDICEEPIKSAWTSYLQWGQIVCYKHNRDGSDRCCGCQRFKLGDMRYMSLNDGRKLCLECLSVAVMDTEESKALFHEVHEFYRGLNMKVRKDIPFFLVDHHEMNKILHKQGRDKYSQHILGVTTYQLDVVTSVARVLQRKENIDVVKEIQYLSRRRKVTSILVLYGLPKLETGATLAHEMMHAWMRLEGYRGLDDKVAEGICEVMAHKWLDWHAFVGDDFISSTGEKSQFLRNLKEDLKDRIETNFSLTYGEGFRDAKWAVERYGLRYTMKHIAETGQFPQ